LSIENVKHVKRLISDVYAGCDHCDYVPGLNTTDLDTQINHYIKEHGYRLLHIGPESSRDYEHNPVTLTVAVLGNDSPPPIVTRTGTKVVVEDRPGDF
jgi:hypothetical protein